MHSITAAIINVTYNENLAAKITIIQEEGYVSSSTKHVESALSETLK